jgi:hypothetical protein
MPDFHDLTSMSMPELAQDSKQKFDTLAVNQYMLD